MNGLTSEYAKARIVWSKSVMTPNTQPSAKLSRIVIFTADKRHMQHEDLVPDMPKLVVQLKMNWEDMVVVGNKMLYRNTTWLVCRKELWGQSMASLHNLVNFISSVPAPFLVNHCKRESLLKLTTDWIVWSVVMDVQEQFVHKDFCVYWSSCVLFCFKMSWCYVHLMDYSLPVYSAIKYLLILVFGVWATTFWCFQQRTWSSTRTIA